MLLLVITGSESHSDPTPWNPAGRSRNPARNPADNPAEGPRTRALTERGRLMGVLGPIVAFLHVTQSQSDVAVVNIRLTYD